MNRILFEISTVTISSSSRETLKTYLIGQVNLDRWESIPIIMFKSIKSFPFLWNQRVNHGLPHPVTFSARYLWLGRSGGSKKPIPSENKRKHNHLHHKNPNSSLKNKKNQHISNDRNFPQLFFQNAGKTTKKLRCFHADHLVGGATHLKNVSLIIGSFPQLWGWKWELFETTT